MKGFFEDSLLRAFDSLWFHTNILVPPPAPLSGGEGSGGGSLLPTFPDDSDEVLVLSAPRPCDDRAHVRRGVPLQAAKCSQEEAEQAVRPRSNASTDLTRGEKKRCCLLRLDEIKGCLDLGFSLEEMGLDDRLMPIIRGLQGTAAPAECNMPPLSDGIAMKEHLKSWAHVVACTVR